ncbi:ser thr protein phosphatase family protein, putative [Ichthyophthirius multifiliis]|uniref:Ser thr protein phosphatase family protein, putative n=1 Tax=Ichthyophthirius multifiliis TaxID=5932 RepID=G0QUL0_ICHMU|nr:ser thr protein phosphatase family protein, putative [Ichthyophthirius multifiliis]EGR31094.1 ser thr protein phosphatase family protein, putative [Ichthyophthirius multifiliis]|eukprot:XP_004034580.1 ser thr protein phosphatase family protein, putative [Ichthyophthirius multifiliis]
MIEKIQLLGESPQPRFGHTMTQINPTTIILYGGATGDTGKYNITGDVYQCDLNFRQWKRLTPSGVSPQNRAAHSATSIENNNKMVIYGGATGGGGMADDNLYLLDFSQEKETWVIIPVYGTTPGRRYGHTISFVKPYLVVFGGNTGSESVNDSWVLNIEKAPYNWQKLEISSENPIMRVYHSAGVCSSGAANGMMVIFGGRTQDQSALNDSWGLRRHRDGRWDWVKAPYRINGEQPLCRYQHSTIFQGPLMFVIGGRSNQINENVPLEIYDTESSDWYKFNFIQRFRHCVWILQQYLFIHGGFDSLQPNVPTDSNILKVDMIKLVGNYQNLTRVIGKFVDIQNGEQKEQTNNKQQQVDLYQKNQQKQNNNDDNKQQNQQEFSKNQNQKIIRLAQEAVIGVSYDPNSEQENQTKKVAIQKLQKQGIKLNQNSRYIENSEISNKKLYYESIFQIFIDNLHLPTQYENATQKDYLSYIKKEYIHKLCDEVQKVFEKEPMLLRLRAPIKIFGNLNGQYEDLMRFFNHFGSPFDNQSPEDDIDNNDYLFLGNYLGRGTMQIEIILLLFALKLKFQDQFFMLRGNMEDKKINKCTGFADECILKFQEDPNDPFSIFQKINKVFEFMPLGCILEDNIFCVHSGIGNSIKNIEEIEQIPRPLEIFQDPKTYQHKIALDLLWSDPVLDDFQQENIQNDVHDVFGFQNVIRFGNQRIQNFLNDNNLAFIVRSNECVLKGYQKQSNNIITIFSNTNYAGVYQNNASILYVGKQRKIQPKVIQCNVNFNSQQNWFDLEQIVIQKNNPTKNLDIDKDESLLRKKQGTPPRDAVIKQ